MPMTAMRTESQQGKTTSPTSIWRVECWRMLRQWQPIFWFSIGLVAAFQLLFFSQAILAGSIPANVYMEMLYEAVPYSGLLFVLGVVCSLFGMEREYGSWHWRSHLPRSWWAELTVQFASMTLGCVLCCLVTFFLAYLLDSLTVYGVDEQGMSFVYQVNRAFLYGSVLGVPMVVVGLLATDRVLPGLFLGLIAAFLLEILFVTLLYSLNQFGFWSVWYTHSILTLCATSLAFYMYHWRWRYGQYWHWRLRAIPRESRPVHLQADVSTFWSLTYATLRKYWFGLLLLVGFVPMLIWPLTQPFILGFVGVFFCWAGLHAVSEDRRNDQIRFFGDRGVSTTKIWYARFALPFLLVLVPMAVIAVADIRTPFFEFGPALYLTTSLCMFTLSLGARLAFRSWASALFVVLLMTGIGWALMGTAYHAGGTMGLLLATSLVVGATGIGSYFQLHQLMNSMEPRTIRIWLATNAVWIVSILGLYPFQRAYWVPWVDLPAANRVQATPLMLPNWNLQNIEPLPELTPLVRQVLWAPDETFHNDVWNLMRQEFDPINNRPHRDTERFYRSESLSDEEAREVMERLRSTVEEPLGYLEGRTQKLEPAQASIADVITSFDDTSLITSWTADLFVVAVSVRDADLARRALDLHYQASLKSWYRFNRSDYHDFPLIRNQDLSWFLAQYSVEELLPKEPNRSDLQNFLTSLKEAESAIPSFSSYSPKNIRRPRSLAQALVERQRTSRSSAYLSGTTYRLPSVLLEGLTADAWWERERTRRLSRQSLPRALERLDFINVTNGNPDIHALWILEADHSWWLPYYEDTSRQYHLTQPQRSFLLRVRDQKFASEKWRMRLRMLAASVEGEAP